MDLFAIGLLTETKYLPDKNNCLATIEVKYIDLDSPKAKIFLQYFRDIYDEFIDGLSGILKRYAFLYSTAGTEQNEFRLEYRDEFTSSCQAHWVRQFDMEHSRIGISVLCGNICSYDTAKEIEQYIRILFREVSALFGDLFNAGQLVSLRDERGHVIERKRRMPRWNWNSYEKGSGERKSESDKGR